MIRPPVRNRFGNDLVRTPVANQRRRARSASNDGMDSSRSLSRHHCRELWVAPRNQEEAEMNAMTVAVDLAKDVFEVAVANRAGRIVERKRLRSEEHTSELQSQSNLVCRLLLEKK